MPINVKVVSQKEFDEWISFAQDEYASIATDKKNILIASK